MSVVKYRQAAFVLLASVTFAWAFQAQADTLPKSTIAMLDSLKIEQEILAGTDEEMKVPDAWIAGAKKESKLRLIGSRDAKQFTEMVKPFRERYPFIEMDYSRTSYGNRVIGILTAFKQGRVTSDVITGLGGSVAQFKEINALENLSDIPNVSKAPANMRDEEGFWVGHQVTHWCITYNTKLVKESDLPKTWEDLLTNPIWSDGHLGLGNRPQLWMLSLLGVKGQDWVKDYLAKLFGQMNPQLRKEGVNAMISLTTVGELWATLPGSGYRTQLESSKGAPVSFHCPVPVPVSVNLMAIMRGGNTNAAKLFVNWNQSKEGQIAQYYADASAPTHQALLNDERFVPYAKNIAGKPLAARSANLLEDSADQLFELWNSHWEKRAVKAPL
jgi:iron(III) transport system substrate-binding protein